MYNYPTVYEETYKKELPTVRIHKIFLENLKSVEHGEVALPSFGKFVEQGTRSEILGIYGQNGSGKTTIIEVLAILKQLMRGGKLHDRYADIVRIESPGGRCEITFDFQYNNGVQQTITYEFSLVRVTRENENPNPIEHNSSKLALEIRNEKISIAGSFDGKRLKKQPLMDTSSEDMPFEPISKYEVLTGGKSDKNIKWKLLNSKNSARKESRSFIFNKDTIDILRENCENDTFLAVLVNLALYAKNYLHVVDTRGTGMISLNAGIELNVWRSRPEVSYAIPVYFYQPNMMSVDFFPDLEEHIVSMNTVLTRIIPGMSLALNNLGPAVLNNGNEGIYFDLTSNRNGTIIPLRCESDGIQKIISVLNLFIAVYNQKSTTVAIDELDAGIFEYLLGEIIRVIDKSGVGQLIFTSHNLRPLEVLDDRSIIFTTTNENNRYIRMSNVQTNNNLRDKYFRTILLGGQEEELYSEADTFEIERSFRKADKLWQKVNSEE